MDDWGYYRGFKRSNRREGFDQIFDICEACVVNIDGGFWKLGEAKPFWEARRNWFRWAQRLEGLLDLDLADSSYSCWWYWERLFRNGLLDKLRRYRDTVHWLVACKEFFESCCEFLSWDDVESVDIFILEVFWVRVFLLGSWCDDAFSLFGRSSFVWSKGREVRLVDAVVFRLFLW